MVYHEMAIVTAEHEIIIPGIPYKTNSHNIKAKVLEIV